MKIIITLLILCSHLYAFSQESKNNAPFGVLLYDRSNVVYRDMEYKMYAIAHGGYDETILEGYNVEIKRDTMRPYLYSVKFKDSTTAALDIIARHKGNSYYLSRFTYVVENKPLPIVFIDNIRSGNIIDSKSINIEIKHPDEIKIKENFSIDSWEVIINEKQFKGKGNVLSKEVVSEIELTQLNKTLIVKVKTFEYSGLITGVFLIN